MNAKHLLNGLKVDSEFQTKIPEIIVTNLSQNGAQLKIVYFVHFLSSATV